MQAELAKVREKELPSICRNEQKVFLLSFNPIKFDSIIIQIRKNSFESCYPNPAL